MQPNGVITEYQLQCSSGIITVSANLSGSATSYTFRGLEPYTSYTCRITAHNSDGEGPAATKLVLTLPDCESGKLFSECVGIIVFSQLPVDLPRESPSHSPPTPSPFPGLLPSPHNKTESSPAILSPVAQEAALSILPEQAAQVWSSHVGNHLLNTLVLSVPQQLWEMVQQQ